MPIDFSAYAPNTVLRVRCRDGVEGVLHPNRDRSAKPNILIRDDRWNDWVTAHGRVLFNKTHDLDVTEIIGEMVLVQGN